ncbi:class I SAM-dependent methyltransferase [Microbacterium hominis]|uniref:class I SAM-dependent methyltransferase n=1 Tax=Microbacterium hominis TaxID=162426 RepID=UPI000ADB6E0C|nr:class I SAM-dependent methyltransferase [Microbacterium hominis]
MRDADFGGPYDAVFASAVLLHVPRARLRGVLRVLHRRQASLRARRSRRAVRPGEHCSGHNRDAPRYPVLWREDPPPEALAATGGTDVVVRDATAPDAAATDPWITVTARNPEAG